MNKSKTAKIKNVVLEKLADPVLLKQFHGWATVVWMIMVIPTVLTGLKSSVTYIVFLSVYAVIMGHWSSWQASRTEVAVMDPDTQTNSGN